MVQNGFTPYVLQLVDGNGTEVFAATYDAWGNRTVTNNTFPLRRGYTMHEHWDCFGLINMDGRFYDPVVGRFLSPYPYVQMPESSQDLNRYSYCMNNPLKYTDPNGEFIIGFISGFFRGLFTGGNPFKSAWDGGVNELKIWGGLLASDGNKNFGERLVEVFSRFTWQLPQTVAGFTFSEIPNTA